MFAVRALTRAERDQKPVDGIGCNSRAAEDRFYEKFSYLRKRSKVRNSEAPVLWVLAFEVLLTNDSIRLEMTGPATANQIITDPFRLGDTR